MKPDLTTRRHRYKALVACLLLFSPLAGAYDEESPGWSPREFVEPAPWQEQESGLPAYPQQDGLLEVAISTDGQPYTIHIDPASLTMGEDQVVRYTVVIISSSGVWNVYNEGLHCGERAYRRYAYGFEGEWQPLADSAWRPVSGYGVNQYRKTFYNVYMCNPTEPFLTAGQVLRKLRSGSSVVYE